MKDFSFNALFNEAKKIRKNLASSASKGVSAVVNEKKIISDQLSAEKRLDICNQCPHLEKKMGRCDICGCFVSLKVKLDFETCPAGKW